MKIGRIALFIWLAGASWAGAQLSQSLNGPSITQRYGANPSTPSQMFQAPPKPADTSTAGPNNPTGSNPTAASPAGTSTPAVSGNVPAVAASATLANPAPAGTSVSGADLANFPMPETMSQIDNQRKLTVADQFVYQVLEDRDKPVLLFVDEKGEIAPNIPYFPEMHMNVLNHTLYEVANELQKLLTDPKVGYYKQATVLLAFYKGNVSRGQVYVFGEVPKPGPVNVPSDSVLTLYQAILAAGGFRDTADKTHVQLTRQNFDDASKITQQVVDFQKFFDGQAPEPNVVVQPGDVINVPSRNEHPQDDIIVDGEVRSPLVLPAPPPNGKPLYLSEVMIQAGWTDWSNHTVELFRYKDGKKTEEDHDVDDVLVKGNKDKDVQLQPGDFIYVKRNWWSFGG